MRCSTPSTIFALKCASRMISSILRIEVGAHLSVSSCRSASWRGLDSRKKGHAWKSIEVRCSSRSGQCLRCEMKRACMRRFGSALHQAVSVRSIPSIRQGVMVAFQPLKCAAALAKPRNEQRRSWANQLKRMEATNRLNL